ncbi:MAG: glycerol-3-phosphate acyltransferase [Chloroflexota bacterium]
MEWSIAILAAVVGYAFGSISFARILARIFLPGEDISQTEFDIPGSDQKFVMESVSATSLSARKGPKAGCSTGILDMVKAAVPILGFRYFYPEADYFLLTAVFTVIGHNFPIQHRFKGGRGLSPIIGGMFVIDWLFVPISFILSNLFGLAIVRDMFVGYTSFVVLLIPWVWYRFNDPAYILYAVAINIVFWVSMRPELTMYLKYKRSGEINRSDFLQSLEGTDAGRAIKYARKYGLLKDE